MYNHRKGFDRHAQKKKKNPALLMILSALSSEDELVPLWFFLQFARFNTVAYTKVLKLCITSVGSGRMYVF